MGIMAIQHNMLAANAARQFNNTDLRKAKVTEKLASGFRINRAAEDVRKPSTLYSRLTETEQKVPPLILTEKLRITTQ